MVKSQTLKRHYPELWLGIIIRCVKIHDPTLVHHPRLIRQRSYCIVIVLAIILIFILRRENQRRDRLQLDEKEAEKTAFEDLTDKENPHFRYVY
jgi:hypothetical protein